MTLAVGPISLVANSPQSPQLSVAVATGGTGPYTYQWYRSSVTGFSPGGGNIIAGATAVTLTDSGLIPNATYYYVVVVTDTGNSNATANSAQFTLLTQPAVVSQNQFAQVQYIGMVELPYNYDTLSAAIDPTQPASVIPYSGMAVKVVANTLGGIPRVVTCTANTDEVWGFINYDIKSPSYSAYSRIGVSTSGNVIWLYSTGAIAQLAQVTVDVTAGGGVGQKVGSSGANIVGYALDGCSASGVLIRVKLATPSYAFA